MRSFLILFILFFFLAVKLIAEDWFKWRGPKGNGTGSNLGFLKNYLLMV